MRFQPIKQFNTILQQEYLEPTISWSIRVVLALNVPLIVFPLFLGFSYHIIWAAFGAYMLTLIDYRGSHYRKMLIQSVEAILILIAAILGMNIGNSVILSVIGMFVIGVFAALIRNWSDYGSTIGVGVGFFYLFGISNPNTFGESLVYGKYIIYGALWAIAIIFLSFPFTASNPMRRSIATIWKKNTDYLDAVLENYLDPEIDNQDLRNITSKEIEIRAAIDKSMELFNRRKENSRFKAEHYDQMIEARKVAAYFGASARVIHEELYALRGHTSLQNSQSIIYKTISALSQASARLSIVIFTFRGEDLTMAKVRIKRFEIAVRILKSTLKEQTWSPEELFALKQLVSSLEQCYEYLQDSIDLIHEKLNFKRSNYFENYKLSFNHFIAGLQPRVILQIIREVFNIDSQQFKYSLRVGLGLALSVFIFKFFKIDHGHWIALTLLIVIQPYYGATRKKGFERIIGTVAGIVVGGAIMLLPIKHETFVVILIFISFFVAYYLRNNYKVGVFFVTIMMVVMMQLSKQGSWDLIWWRVLSTLIGSALAILISFAFWPIWEKQRFPSLLNHSFNQNLFFLNQVILSYEKKLPSGITWHRSRRLSEAANNNLFACVQRMYEEPQAHQREIDVHFAKVGSNVRISREITSLAFGLEKITSDKLAPVLDEYMEEIQIIFYKHMQRESKIDFKKARKILQNPVLTEDQLSQAVQVDLEKIVFELEALQAFRGR
ncbi:FUSC family protein [Fluviicola sp.]|uniref:FUSC family protein n=1 Tax=Fluviicola sp. TaxID=1917219 RepID=UPI00262E451D|nr:FUSC family protein [Fluviicola sp.]